MDNCDKTPQLFTKSKCSHTVLRIVNVVVQFAVAFDFKQENNRSQNAHTGDRTKCVSYFLLYLILLGKTFYKVI